LSGKSPAFDIQLLNVGRILNFILVEVSASFAEENDVVF
jgi:hypothetical protein